MIPKLPAHAAPTDNHESSITVLFFNSPFGILLAIAAPLSSLLKKAVVTSASKDSASTSQLQIALNNLKSFEMPYNIWCEGCKNHIGMGVRYNAEKSKIGNYYSTSIYKFRFGLYFFINQCFAYDFNF